MQVCRSLQEVDGELSQARTGATSASKILDRLSTLRLTHISIYDAGSAVPPSINS